MTIVEKKTLNSKKISFRNEEGKEFITLLKERVANYFREKKLSPKANIIMYLKSIFLMSVSAVVYGLILANLGGGVITFALYILLGMLISFGTMNIAHDALHGAYMTRSFGNRALGLLMDVFGASSYYWRKEHVVDHHTFTNIAEHDADLDAPFLLRLCPKAERRSFHRFQHLYAPFLYCMNIMRWVYFSDYKRIYKAFTAPSSKHEKPPNTEIALLFSFKIIHTFLFLLLPMMVLSIPAWQVFISYVAFLAIAGLTLTVIFQLAHIVENTSFPLPDEVGKMENSFAIHQLATTSNFAMQNKFVTFLLGGLNYQVEHHLFPQISHRYLPRIAPIVEQTAKEFNIPYNQSPTFFSSIKSHFAMLKKLGRQ